MQRSLQKRVRNLEATQTHNQEFLGEERARSLLNMFVRLGGLSPEDVTEEEIQKVASWPSSKGPLSPAIQRFMEEEL